ncbi:nuclear transport factor 2 family protein [Streptomyces sp. NBC_00878]|uniref:nuclear transport factor 2 family protein n=1 Tax=Streptomyces sp. NBC_00878 TaxID=2975854 RepID=UPI0022575421|nr:nuclear transport factor 2 family protein [Streptomyces sp. NBC_00878]MCX4902828.1 nuclear transport factor 2 family protein [Streptomyces sp. NBC_00878]
MGSQREQVMNTLDRYLRLCDVPVRGEGMVELGELFTDDAVWEGVGPEYSGEFGRREGRQAILEMLAGYLPPNPHFRENVHLLFPGTIDLSDTTARGTWLMQQLSRYASGTAEVRVARLDVTFRLDPVRPALISLFRTERLFSAPLASASPLSAPPPKEAV